MNIIFGHAHGSEDPLAGKRITSYRGVFEELRHRHGRCYFVAELERVLNRYGISLCGNTIYADLREEGMLTSMDISRQLMPAGFKQVRFIVKQKDAEKYLREKTARLSPRTRRPSVKQLKNELADVASKRR